MAEIFCQHDLGSRLVQQGVSRLTPALTGAMTFNVRTFRNTLPKGNDPALRYIFRHYEAGTAMKRPGFSGGSYL